MKRYKVYYSGKVKWYRNYPTLCAPDPDIWLFTNAAYVNAKDELDAWWKVKKARERRGHHDELLV